MIFATSVLSRYSFGAGATVPPTPPTPAVVVNTTQTFQGFGGGFLGPYHKHKREEIYAKAQLFGPPPVYRFNHRDLLPALSFKDPLPQDPLLRMAARAPSAVKLPTIWMKFNQMAFDPEKERKRKLRKRQREEDEIIISLL